MYHVIFWVRRNCWTVTSSLLSGDLKIRSYDSLELALAVCGLLNNDLHADLMAWGEAEVV